jgi:hypothetical protein
MVAKNMFIDVKTSANYHRKNKFSMQKKTTLESARPKRIQPQKPLFTAKFPHSNIVNKKCKKCGTRFAALPILHDPTPILHPYFSFFCGKFLAVSLRSRKLPRLLGSHEALNDERFEPVHRTK